MKVKNISEGTINLKSGSIKPGEEGVSNSEEYKLLMNSNLVECTQFKKKVVKKKAVKKNG